MADLEKDIDITEEILEESAEDFAEEVLEEREAKRAFDNEETSSEEDVSEEITEGESSKEQEKKGLFGKKKDKKDKKDIQIEELTDKLKRNLAEFENFRNRTEKEKTAMYEIGAKNVIEKILPVVDNFERGLSTIPEEEKGSAFSEGMDMIYKQLMKTLEEIGVAPIEAVGKEFDPNLHNAVMHVESEEVGENIITTEFQKGYTYKGNVVRHSMVQVAN